MTYCVRARHPSCVGPSAQPRNPPPTTTRQQYHAFSPGPPAFPRVLAARFPGGPVHVLHVDSVCDRQPRGIQRTSSLPVRASYPATDRTPHTVWNPPQAWRATSGAALKCRRQLHSCGSLGGSEGRGDTKRFAGEAEVKVTAADNETEEDTEEQARPLEPDSQPDGSRLQEPSASKGPEQDGQRAGEEEGGQADAVDERVSTAGPAELSTAAESGPGEETPPDWRQSLSLTAVLLAVFLNLLGFTVSGPILPALATHFAMPMSQIGYLSAAYPLGMLGALFVWPKLSDSVGRRPIIVASLACSGVGFLLQALVVYLQGPLWVFLSLRVASGALAGASPVMKAAIADLAGKEELPRYMGYREAAATLAFIIGPSIGGIMFSSWSLAAVIAISGWVSILAAGLVYTCLHVPSTGANQRELENEAASAEMDAAEAWAAPSSCPVGRTLASAIATICVVSFLYNMGQATFDAFFPVLVSTRFGLPAKEIGYILTCLAAVSFSVSAGGFHRFQKLAGLTTTSAVGLVLVASGLLCIGLATELSGLCIAAAVYVVGIPLFTPTVPILLMQCIPASMRGQVMGIDSAVNTVGRILSPVLFGVLYAKCGELYAFAVSALLVFAAAVVTLVTSYATATMREQRPASK